MSAAVIAVLVVTLTHITGGGGGGGGTSCSVSPPLPSLPSRLRSLGGFDQPQDPSDTPTVQSFAVQAATAVVPGLIGTVAQPPVRVHALASGQPDALIVPLQSKALGLPHPVIAGLVSLLLDCAGRAYYSAVDDLTLRTATAPPAFPAVTAADAAERLGTAQPQLTYTESPFAPMWRNPDTGATIAAFAA